MDASDLTPGTGGGTAAVWRQRELLWVWTLREIRIRYKQSLLGLAWAILQPLAFTAVFTFVFTWLVPIDTGAFPYPLFAYVAVLPWTFFANGVSFGTQSLVSNMGLVTKASFAREILPLASVGAALVDLAAGSTILAALMLVYGFVPGSASVWLPALLAMQVLLVAGIALAGAATMVFFRDTRFVIPLALQVWMYVTPVIYPIDRVPEAIRPLYYLNPMVGIIDGYRRVLLENVAPRTDALATSALVVTVVLLVGYPLFKRLEPRFADAI